MIDVQLGDGAGTSTESDEQQCLHPGLHGPWLVLWLGLRRGLRLVTCWSGPWIPKPDQKLPGRVASTERALSLTLPFQMRTEAHGSTRIPGRCVT